MTPTLETRRQSAVGAVIGAVAVGAAASLREQPWVVAIAVVVAGLAGYGLRRYLARRRARPAPPPPPPGGRAGPLPARPRPPSVLRIAVGVVGVFVAGFALRYWDGNGGLGPALSNGALVAAAVAAGWAFTLPWPARWTGWRRT